VARGDGKLDQIVYYGAILGGGWIGLNMAASGAFGSSFQTFAQQLKAAVTGSVPSVTVGAGGARIAVPGSAAPAAPSGAPCNAPPYQSYGGGVGHFVEDAGSGVYRTIINDQVIYTGTREGAESAYRRHYGCAS
jgi:hypothetical protein